MASDQPSARWGEEQKPASRNPADGRGEGKQASRRVRAARRELARDSAVEAPHTIVQPFLTEIRDHMGAVARCRDYNASLGVR